MEAGSAFVVWTRSEFADILCEQFERTAGNENWLPETGPICAVRGLIPAVAVLPQAMERR